MLVWKSYSINDIQERFTKRYPSFEELKAENLPILKRNLNLFDSYGPEHVDPSYSEHHALWVEFQGELIANNRKLATILRRNQSLLHKENRETIDTFISHMKEFIATRDHPSVRLNLFPRELNSIFGLEQVNHVLAPNVSALQNFITYLLREGRFVGLDLVSHQVLIPIERN